MEETIKYPSNYRIEVSGWAHDNSFFVEKTDLFWSQTNRKRVRLHQALPEGSIVFIRLMSPESWRSPAPVAYWVEGIQPMDCNGVCEMSLQQVQPLTKAPEEAVGASDASERTCEHTESSRRLEPEEVLS
jgi:hypothetical protein